MYLVSCSLKGNGGGGEKREVCLNLIFQSWMQHRGGEGRRFRPQEKIKALIVRSPRQKRDGRKFSDRRDACNAIIVS